MKIATLDPFAGYKRAIGDELDDDTAVVVDAFHIVKLGNDALDQVRRRVQQDTLGHRGRSGDPLYRIRNLLHAGKEKLTPKQHTKLTTAFTAREEHIEVEVAWHCAQQLRAAYKHPDLTEGRQLAEHALKTFPTCPIPEIARLGRTLTRWRKPLPRLLGNQPIIQRRHRSDL